MFRSQNFQQISTTTPIIPSFGTKFAVPDWAGNLYIIDIATESLITTSSITASPGGIYGIGYGNGKIMITYYTSPGSVQIIDAATYASITTVSLDDYPWGVDYINGNFWVAAGLVSTPNLTLIDGVTNTITTNITGTQTFPQGVATGNNKVISTDYGGGGTYLYDAITQTLIASLGGGSNGTAVAFGDNKFLATSVAGPILIIDAITNTTLVSITSSAYMSGGKAAYGDGYFAVADVAGYLIIIESATNSIFTTVDLTGYAPVEVTYGGGKFGVVSNGGDVLFVSSTTHTLLSVLSFGGNANAITTI